MIDYRRSAHAVYDIKYHVIWVTKYRYKVMRGRVAERARELIRQICEAREIVIVRGAISPDHIHMLLSVPPHLAPSKVMQAIKNSRSWGRGIGGSICGRGDISARRWVR